MDAIQTIQADHREIEKLFKDFERAEHAGDAARCAGVARALVRALSIHAAIEEQYVYPALRSQAGDARVLDALEEHHGVKLILDEVGELPPGSPRLAPKLRVLAENVRRHVQQEERELLPALGRALDGRQLRELGETLAHARDAAPTRPHPASPDTPPGNLVASPVAAIVDRSRDALRDGALMLQTIAALAMHSGMQGTRRAAARARATVRDGAREAVEGAGEVGREVGGELRAATDRVEARGAEAARAVRRPGRPAAQRRRSGAGRTSAKRARAGR